jgi:hypothetical protein
MQRYADDRMILRNARMGKIMLFGGMGVLVLGLVISILRPAEQNIVIALALAGMFTSQFGIAFTTRWGRRPRMDELLDDAFKGMDSRTSLFHYCLGTSHALITSTGVYALVPRTDEGVVRYADGAWSSRQEKRGFLRRLGTRPVKNIEREADVEIDALAHALRKRLPEAAGIEPGAIVLFLHPRATIQTESAPLPAFHIKKAKEGVRRLEKRATLSPDQVETLAQKLRLK